MKDPEKYGYPSKEKDKNKEQYNELPKLKRMNTIEEKHFIEHLQWHVKERVK